MKTQRINLVTRAFFVSVCGLLVLLSTAVVAAQSEDAAPLKLIEQTTHQMIAALKRDKAIIENKPAHIFELVEKIVLPHFDFNRMSKLVLGKYWRKASEQQRHNFTQEFRGLLVRTYATAMDEYSDKDIIYLPFRAAPGATDVVVKVEVEQQGGFPVPLDYKLYLLDGQWKVYEVLIDGVSLIVNYRTSFAQKIRRNGGLDVLIKTLKKRNQQALDDLSV